MVKGWKTVTLRESTIEKLEGLHKTSRTEKKLTPWIDEFLLMNVEKSDFVSQKYAPFLKNMGIHDDFVLLDDQKIKKFVKVFLKDEKLQCEHDENTECVHTQYVMALPELSNFFKKD